jgi:hypothetical protein
MARSIEGKYPLSLVLNLRRFRTHQTNLEQDTW